MKIVTSAQMRKIEAACERSGLPTGQLMENAGRTVARQVKARLETPDGQNVIVLVGPGNNGGDGLVAARCLHEWGAGVAVYIFGRRQAEDTNLRKARDRDIPVINISEIDQIQRLDEALVSGTAVIDALLGTGASRPLSSVFASALQTVAIAAKARSGLRIFALDVPSGLNADTGAADPSCLRANETITLGFPKRGLYNRSTELAGEITIADIGIPAQLAEGIGIELYSAARAKAALPARPATANKGTFGRALVVAGSPSYIGAAYLACSGAMRSGAGLVTLATVPSLQPALAAKLIETTYLLLPEGPPGAPAPEAAETVREKLSEYDALLIGCGLGRSPAAARLIESLFLNDDRLPPLVLDADALNLLSGIPEWWRRLPGNAILTPHPGEMARLAGMEVSEVQADRIGTAERKANEWQKTIVLKGACTVTASPGEITAVNPAANPGLASAGTGDVLAGVIAGLVAQGLGRHEAATCGVYLHGVAGEIVRERLGEAGMIASDLLPALPLAIKTVKQGRTDR